MKNGRKVIALNFQIEHKAQETNEMRLIRKAIPFDITREEIYGLLREFSVEQLDKVLEVLKAYKGHIKNPILFLKKALKYGWHPFINDNNLESLETVSLLLESQKCKDIRQGFISHKGKVNTSHG